MSDYYSDDDDYGGGYSFQDDDYGGGYSFQDDDYGGGYSIEEDHNCGGHSTEENHGGNNETDSDEEENGRNESESEDKNPPCEEVVKSNSGSYEYGNTSKYQYKDLEGGKDYSAKFTDAYKTQDFVDKRNGNQVYKEEVKHDSQYKVDDKVGRFTTEYQTQVKTSKKVTYK